MRWVADIKHDVYKIVVLQMGERYLLQVEDGGLVQTFKFKIPEELPSVASIKEKVDETFLKEISLNFRQMRQMRGRFLDQSEPTEEQFPEIL